jgi:hypothetical protein
MKTKMADGFSCRIKLFRQEHYSRGHPLWVKGYPPGFRPATGPSALRDSGALLLREALDNSSVIEALEDNHQLVT